MGDIMKLHGCMIVFVRNLSDKGTKATLSRLIQFNKETFQLFGPKISKRKTNRRTKGSEKTNDRIVGGALSNKTALKNVQASSFDSGRGNNIKPLLPSTKQLVNNNGSNVTDDLLGSEFIAMQNFYKDPAVLKKYALLPEHERLALKYVLNAPLFTNFADNQNASHVWSGVPTPSVSRVMKDSMSEESLMILARWEKKMIEELGKDGFDKYKATMFQNGNKFHSCIQQFLEKKQVTMFSEVEGYWNSLQPVLKDIDNVVAVEQTVTNNYLNYKGIFDCVATYQGRPCLIDWKTSQKPKSSIDKTYDQPLQLVAYLSAFNNSLARGHFDDANSVSQRSLRDLGIHKEGKFLENCLLVISYENGSNADVHLMNKKTCTKYWSQWIGRLHKYWFDLFMSKCTRLNS